MFNRSEWIRNLNRTHGDTNTPEFAAWKNMRARCTQKSYRSFKDYGGRGISVCDRWGKYTNFLEDMGRKPFPRAMLDRIDTNGNYEPSNCRWVTPQQSAGNRRLVKAYTVDGVARTIPEWSRIAGLSIKVIWTRISLGWPPKRAVQTPVRSHVRKIKKAK